MDIDSKIIELFQTVAKQKSEVEEQEAVVKKSWKTTCSIKLPWIGANSNIQTASAETLEEIMIYLNQIIEAKKTLGTDKKIQGFGFEDWKEDLGKRLAVIEIRSRKVELDQLEKRLNAIVSPEQKREMELKSILEKLS